MKPSDFFLGVVNFLGVLVPGALLLLLRGWTFATDKDLKDLGIPVWLVFGGIAYVAGQFLLGATERFNDAARPRWLSRQLHDDVVQFRDQAGDRLKALRLGSDQAKFHTALSYLRTTKPEATAEIDHHMADYKLLRNLLAVLAIDLIARTAIRPWHNSVLWILAAESVLIAACFSAFVRMFNWAQLLCFQYVCLIAPSPEAPAKDKVAVAHEHRRDAAAT